MKKIWRKNGMEKHIEVIGIDHGWSNMKTATQIFTTGVKEITTEPAFVAMPSYKAGNRYRDVCFPITKEFREKLNDAVLETYQQAKEQAMQEGKERASQQMQTDDRGFMKASGEPLPFR